MSDTPPAGLPASQLTISVPALLVTLVHDYAQKALTTAAASLVTHGLITSDQTSEFVQLGVGVALFVVSCAWTYIAGKVRTSRLAAAKAA